MNVLVWLAILNCMSAFSGSPVTRSATPVALTNLPLGLQMAIRTPGVWFVSWNRSTIACTLASICAGRGPLPVLSFEGEEALPPQPEPSNDSTANQAPISAR